MENWPEIKRELETALSAILDQSRTLSDEKPSPHDSLYVWEGYIDRRFTFVNGMSRQLHRRSFKAGIALDAAIGDLQPNCRDPEYFKTLAELARVRLEEFQIVERRHALVIAARERYNELWDTTKCQP